MLRLKRIFERTSLFRKIKIFLLRVGLLGPGYRGKPCCFDKLFQSEDPYGVRSREDEPRVKASIDFVLANIQEGTSLLDVGCGEGVITRELGTHFPTTMGIDVSRRALLRASKASKDVTYIVSAMEYLPIRDKSIDVVTSFESLYYTSNDENAIREFYRTLKNGGSSIVSVHGTFAKYLPPKKVIPKLKKIFASEPSAVERRIWSDLNDRVFILFKK